MTTGEARSTTEDPTSAGREEARRLVAELRAREDRAIESRRKALQEARLGGDAAEEDPATPTEVARLRRQVEELAAFRTAVLRSRPWRLIQSARRLFGRAW